MEGRAHRELPQTPGSDDCGIMLSMPTRRRSSQGTSAMTDPKIVDVPAGTTLANALVMAGLCSDYEQVSREVQRSCVFVLGEHAWQAAVPCIDANYTLKPGETSLVVGPNRRDIRVVPLTRAKRIPDQPPPGTRYGLRHLLDGRRVRETGVLVVRDTRDEIVAYRTKRFGNTKGVRLVRLKPGPRLTAAIERAERAERERDRWQAHNAAAGDCAADALQGLYRAMAVVEAARLVKLSCRCHMQSTGKRCAPCRFVDALRAFDAGATGEAGDSAAALSADLEMVQTENDGLEQERDQLRADLEQARAERDDFERKLTIARNGFDGVRERRDAALARVAELAADIQRLRDQYTDAWFKYVARGDEIEALTKERDEWKEWQESTIPALAAERDGYRVERDALRAGVEAEAKRLEDYADGVPEHHRTEFGHGIAEAYGYTAVRLRALLATDAPATVAVPVSDSIGAATGAGAHRAPTPPEPTDDESVQWLNPQGRDLFAVEPTVPASAVRALADALQQFLNASGLEHIPLKYLAACAECGCETCSLAAPLAAVRALLPARGAEGAHDPVDELSQLLDDAGAKVRITPAAAPATTEWKTCGTCRGRGQFRGYDSPDRCPVCRGRGMVPGHVHKPEGGK